MAYRWDSGLRIKVVTDDMGAPVRFKLRGEWHAIERIIERSRVDKGWWDDRVWREVFRVITKAGMLAMVYYEIGSGEWFLQQVSD